MARDIRDFINSCFSCKSFALAQRHSDLQPLETLHPFELVQCNLLGPLPTTSRGYPHLLTIIDVFNRFSSIRPVKSKTAREASEQIPDVFNQLTWPTTLYIDVGNEFSSLKEQLLSRIHAEYAPSHSHRTTGTIEVLNKILR